MIKVEILNHETRRYEEREFDAQEILDYVEKEGKLSAGPRAHVVGAYFRELDQDFSFRYLNEIYNHAMLEVYGRDQLKYKGINLGASGYDSQFVLKK